MSRHLTETSKDGDSSHGFCSCHSTASTSLASTGRNGTRRDKRMENKDAESPEIPLGTFGAPLGQSGLKCTPGSLRWVAATQ